MRRKDRLVVAAMMLTRLGLVAAVGLGLAMLFGAWVTGGAVMLHIVAGAVVVVGIWLATLRFAILGRKVTGPLLAGAILSLAGAALGLGTRNGWVGFDAGVLHFVIMLAAVGLAEMGSARLQRS